MKDAGRGFLSGFFALLIVLLLLLVLEQSMKTIATAEVKNQLQQARLRFLARSALEHCLYSIKRGKSKPLDLLERAESGEGVALGQKMPSLLESLASLAIPFDEGLCVGFYRVQELGLSREDGELYLNLLLEISLEGRGAREGEKLSVEREKKVRVEL